MSPIILEVYKINGKKTYLNLDDPYDLAENFIYLFKYNIIKVIYS